MREGTHNIIYMYLFSTFIFTKARRYIVRDNQCSRTVNSLTGVVEGLFC